jgi:hypothetical protein
MALDFICDYCGQSIYREHDWVRMQAEDRSENADRHSLKRMGLKALDAPLQQGFHFHLLCFERVVGLLEDHRDWAESSNGLELPSWAEGELDGPAPAAEEPTGEPGNWTENYRRSNEEGGIGYLRLDSAVWTALVRAGVVTIRELDRRVRAGTLTRIPGIGPKRVEAVRAALASV